MIWCFFSVFLGCRLKQHNNAEIWILIGKLVRLDNAVHQNKLKNFKNDTSRNSKAISAIWLLNAFTVFHFWLCFERRTFKLRYAGYCCARAISWIAEKLVKPKWTLFHFKWLKVSKTYRRNKPVNLRSRMRKSENNFVNVTYSRPVFLTRLDCQTLCIKYQMLWKATLSRSEP